ncbi:hypothetical protein Bbelb_020780 [Branchiostoma belcheri]|nr:hypothetical protein Bbelb_020780 [Branchiostoma belcheri]
MEAREAFDNGFRTGPYRKVRPGLKRVIERYGGPASQDHTAAELMHVARILNGGFFPLLEGTSSAEGARFLGGSKVDQTHRHAVCRGTSLYAAELTWLQQAEMSDIVHFATNPSQILANIEVSGIGRSLSTVDRSSFGGKGVYYSLFSRTWNDSFST